jgi:hypothetical protein
MPTYPLTFPDITPRGASFRLVRSVASSQSPFTLRQQVYQNAGARFEGNLEFPPLTRAQATELQAFFDELYGQFGTFLYGDPNYLVNGARGVASGSPLVAGGSQTGDTLDVDGLGNNITGWLLKGDYIQLGTGTSSELYRVQSDVDTNGSGEATITLHRNLTSSPSDNAAVVVDGAKGLFRMASNVVDFSVGEAQFYSTNFAFVEAVSG